MFLQNKKPLFFWTVFLGILSFFLFVSLVFYGLSHDKLSVEGSLVIENMKSIKKGIYRFGTLNRNTLTLEKNYEGVNCSSNDILKSACDELENITGMKPQIFSSNDKYCFFIKYDKGFYKGAYSNYNDKYFCIDHRPIIARSNYYGICDEKQLVCSEMKALRRLSIEAIILILLFLIILASFIILLVKTSFTDLGRGILAIFPIIFIAIVLIIFFKYKGG